MIRVTKKCSASNVELRPVFNRAFRAVSGRAFRTAALLVLGFVSTWSVQAASVQLSTLPAIVAAQDHFCGTDSHSDAAHAHVRSFLTARAVRGPSVPLFKSGSPPDVGAEQDFRVFESDNWMSLTFQAVDITAAYVLWVETEELDNGNVTNEEIVALRGHLLESTPSGSVEPGQGILENIHSRFGLPPNVDGDGLVDILVYDIGRGPSNTLGYVHSADVNPDAPPGVGNGRDILYLDSDRGTANLTTLAAIAAHEYTHLVHLSYGWDTTFLNEGYAEYAMVMNGYFWRNITFLNQQTEYQRTLMDWRDGGGPGAVDYERAGLFVTYLANLVGPDGVGQMLKGPNMKGPKGIDSVLTMHGDSFANALQDYHAANLFNDRSLGERFGYAEPGRSALRISLADQVIDGENPNIVNGEGAPGTVSSGQSVNSGAVRYFRWADVADFSFTFETPGWRGFPGPFQQQQRETLYARNRVRLVFEPMDGGPLAFQDVMPGTGFQDFPGVYASVTAIFSHLNPEAVPGDQIEFEALWTRPSTIVTDVEHTPVPPSDLAIWPNPVSAGASINISLPVQSPGVYRVDLVDILGRVHDRSSLGYLEAGRNIATIHGGSWSTGTWFIRISGPDYQTTRRITVLR
ncbi:MAG: T9SS type A sorting domain-containing protein [Rhodothermales bacterium]